MTVRLVARIEHLLIHHGAPCCGAMWFDCCGHEPYPWQCTRVRHHPGDHVAGGFEGDVIATAPRQAVPR